MKFRTFLILAVVTLFAGCATYAGLNYDQLFGEAEVRDRTEHIQSAQSAFFMHDVKPIIENRCVVCHACYDAPRQLKLSSVEALFRRRY